MRCTQLCNQATTVALGKILVIGNRGHGYVFIFPRKYQQLCFFFFRPFYRFIFDHRPARFFASHQRFSRSHRSRVVLVGRRQFLFADIINHYYIVLEPRGIPAYLLLCFSTIYLPLFETRPPPNGSFHCAIFPQSGFVPVVILEHVLTVCAFHRVHIILSCDATS